ncbi:unnamed protein product [Anisakis simplex]|uniref:Eukaryotic translation initiation factor 3 30 kDa subunit n=1 Tax=Anisakis simplex TaxID=6269 RepID=A0A0M3JTM1_ANISI|nr:unnamed protein product [Anisakis simplex]
MFYDDDFEVDVKQLDEKKVTVIEEVEDEKPEEHVPKPQPPSKAKPKSKAKDAFKSLASDLGRELTEKEREEMQKKSDLGFAKDLFGVFISSFQRTNDDDEPMSYMDITTVEEFRSYGEETGLMLAKRANATHYVEMMSVLLRVALEKCTFIPFIITVARYLCDPSSCLRIEGIKQKAKGKGASAKPTMKISQKTNAKLKVDAYDDYDGNDDYDDYDDFM